MLIHTLIQTNSCTCRCFRRKYSLNLQKSSADTYSESPAAAKITHEEVALESCAAYGSVTARKTQSPPPAEGSSPNRTNMAVSLESCPAYGCVTAKQSLPASADAAPNQTCMEVYEDMTGYREENDYEVVQL